MRFFRPQAWGKSGCTLAVLALVLTMGCSRDPKGSRIEDHVAIESLIEKGQSGKLLREVEQIQSGGIFDSSLESNDSTKDLNDSDIDGGINSSPSSSATSSKVNGVPVSLLKKAKKLWFITIRGGKR